GGCGAAVDRRHRGRRRLGALRLVARGRDCGVSGHQDGERGENESKLLHVAPPGPRHGAATAMGTWSGAAMGNVSTDTGLGCHPRVSRVLLKCKTRGLGHNSAPEGSAPPAERESRSVDEAVRTPYLAPRPPIPCPDENPNRAPPAPW